MASSSSDDDEAHNAALRSVAIDSHAVLRQAAPAVSTSRRKGRTSSRPSSLSKRASRDAEEGGDDGEDDDDDGAGNGSAGLKFYQIKVQDLLHKHLDKFFEAHSEELRVESEDVTESDMDDIEDEIYDGATRLFNNAPVGILLKRQRTSQGERRLPSRYDSSDEDSTEKHSRLRAAAVEGTSIKTHAEKAQAKAHAKFLAAEAVEERAIKAEAKRVGELRRERGEEWLPSVARQMVKEIRVESEKRRGMSSQGKIGVVSKYKV